MWEVYDALIDGIPDNLKVDEMVCGFGSSCVRSGSGVGFAGFKYYEMRSQMFSENLLGKPLKDVAQCAKSWYFPEASVGQAAINAYYNNPEIARSNGIEVLPSIHSEDRKNDPFIMAQREIRGKKAVIYGHFPHIDRLLEPICTVSIIDFDPAQDGDYPVSAAEYLIPEADYVFISSIAFNDKMMPRLLQLSQHAQISIVGPGTPLAPVLFDFGVHSLSGFIIKDIERAFHIVSGIERVKIYVTGQKTNFIRPDMRDSARI